MEGFDDRKRLGVEVVNQPVQRSVTVYWDTRWGGGGGGVVPER